MPKYEFKNGFRSVLPYYTTHNTHVKKRWVGKTLLDVYQRELGEAKDVVINDIINEKLYISDNVGTTKPTQVIKGIEVLSERKIQEKDVITCTQHRHEPKIVWPENPISVVFEDDDIIVIDKPSGIPVHPTGSYMFNSLSEIVKEMFNFDNIWTCHRLDKVTSGVVILCKNRDAAVKFLNILLEKSNKVKKIYLARVNGKFPDGVYRYTCPILAVNMNGYIQPSNLESLLTLTSTIFERVNFDSLSNTSIVRCQPISGKFHQIRIHLRNLGFPISNDLFYKTQDIPLDTYLMKNELESDMYRIIFEKYPHFAKMQPWRVESKYNVDLKYQQDEFYEQKQTDYININKTFGTHFDDIHKRLANLKQLQTERLQNLRSSTCNECGRKLFEEDYSANSNIYLHALSFEYGGNIKFETDFPQWALPNWSLHQSRN